MCASTFNKLSEFQRLQYQVTSLQKQLDFLSKANEKLRRERFELETEATNLRAILRREIAEYKPKYFNRGQAEKDADLVYECAWHFSERKLGLWHHNELAEFMKAEFKVGRIPYVPKDVGRACRDLATRDPPMLYRHEDGALYCVMLPEKEAKVGASTSDTI